LLRQLDFHAEELRLIDTDLGQVALGRPEVLRLMTVPGVDATVALSIVAAVGDFTRFRTPEKLVAYLGLNPRVRQSGGQPASHGRITKAGPAHARGMLVEAAWSASKAPGPLRAFYQRVATRRGMQVAVVAAARKLTVLCWHLIIKGEDYAYTLSGARTRPRPVISGFRRGFVLVDQAAQDRPTPNRAVDRLWNKRFRTWRTQLQRSMRPPRVVVRGIQGKHPTEVSLSEDQHPVGDLGADGQHEAFGVAVRPRTARRDLDHLDTRVRHDRVERRRELPGAVADEEPEQGDVLAEVHHEVAGLLRGPGPVGMSGHTQDV
jgi:hypothetical protein